MIERSVVLDPAESVFGSHMDLIQAGTLGLLSVVAIAESHTYRDTAMGMDCQRG